MIRSGCGAWDAKRSVSESQRAERWRMSDSGRSSHTGGGWIHCSEMSPDVRSKGRMSHAVQVRVTLMSRRSRRQVKALVFGRENVIRPPSSRSVTLGASARRW